MGRAHAGSELVMCADVYYSTGLLNHQNYQTYMIPHATSHCQRKMDPLRIHCYKGSGAFLG